MASRVRLNVLNTPPPSAERAVAPALPDLSEADLDWDAVDCVLADLDDFVEIRELIGRPADGHPIPLADLVAARDQLVAGELHGLQVTYVFADATWIDTLLRTETGARLLRMAAPSSS
jgi:hypothetical protein